MTLCYVLEDNATVQVWIAGNKIATFSPQAKEAEQRVIHAAAKIKTPRFRNLFVVFWPLENCVVLLVERISHPNRHSWIKLPRGSKLQSQTGSNKERRVVLRSGLPLS